MTAPTHRLREMDREALADHFQSLDPEDRRLRFGISITNERIAEYTARIDFVRDGVFVVRDDRARILGAVHVAVTGERAELGLSVLPGLRGKGIGNALFARAVVHLRNRGMREVFVHCLAENQAMMHLARKNGMRILLEGSESEARLALEPATAHTLYAEWLHDQQAATIDWIRHQGSIARSMLAFFSA